MLKNQKRYLGQIERLKAKISALQRDLVNARADSASATVSEAPMTVSVQSESAGGKKRRAPTEFDPLPTAPSAPRAVVAGVPQASHMKENEVDAISLSTRSVLSVKRDSRGDGIVPLKPAALSPQPAREPLKAVGNNGTKDTTATSQVNASKVHELRARLDAQRQRSGVAGL